MVFLNSIKTRIISITLLVVIISISTLGIIAASISSSAINLSVENALTSISNDVENQINALNETEFTMIRALAELPITRDENVSMEEKCALYKPIPAKDRSKYENVSFYDLEARSITYAGDLVQVSKKDLIFLKA